MLNKLFILVILSILSIIIIKVYYYFKKVEEFNNLVTGKYGKICQSNTIREVYGCGSNEYGQIGFDSEDYGIVHHTIPFSIPSISNITITQIACGYGHSLFITNEGHVYSCGWNKYGQLGLNSTDDETTPQLIQNYYDSNSNSINYDAITITEIACSDYHSLFLTSNNRVYSCGRNSMGQLGLNSIVKERTPQLIENYYDRANANIINYDAITITQIACGGEHSLFLTNEGHVYSCGRNFEGQLSLDLYLLNFAERTPKLIENYYERKSQILNSINYDAITITQIACGGHHSLFLTSNNRVYSCGKNNKGQLGLNSKYTNKRTPQLIGTFNDAITITQIAGGYEHSLFLTNEGHVYSCGADGYGQLGLISTADRKRTPQLIQNYYDNNYNSINYHAITITKIACGYQHSLFLTSNNRVYSCGRNNKGQLGLNSTDDETTPQLIKYYYDRANANIINYDEITITQIAGGYEHSLINTIHLDNTFTILP